MEIQAKIPGIQEGRNNEKATGYSATGISHGCAQPQPTAPTKTIGMPNPAAVYCQQSGGTRVPVQTPQGRQHPVQTTQRRNPSTRGRCGAGIIRLNRNRQGLPTRRPTPGHDSASVFFAAYSSVSGWRCASAASRRPVSRWASSS